MTLSVEIDSKKVDAALESSPKKTGVALLRSLKRGTKSARTLAARVVSKDMSLKVSDVRVRIRITEPTAQTLSGKLGGDLRRIPLIKFRAKGPEPSRGRGRGVSYRGKTGKRLPHAFISTMPGAHRGVFQRKSSSRLPIQQLFGPSVGHVFSEHRGEIMARGEEQVLAELNRLLDRILGTK